MSLTFAVIFQSSDISVINMLGKLKHIFFYWNSWSLTPPTLGFPRGGNPKWCATWDRTLGFTQLFPTA